MTLASPRPPTSPDTTICAPTSLPISARQAGTRSHTLSAGLFAFLIAAVTCAVVTTVVPGSLAIAASIWPSAFFVDAEVSSAPRVDSGAIATTRSAWATRGTAATATSRTRSAITGRMWTPA